jgi:hypothetical protein
MKAIRSLMVAIAFLAAARATSAQDAKTVSGATSAVRSLLAHDPYLSNAGELRDTSKAALKNEVKCDTTVVQPRTDSAALKWAAIAKPFPLIGCKFKGRVREMYAVESARVSNDTAFVAIRYFYFAQQHGLVDQRRTYILLHINGKWTEKRRSEVAAGKHW